MQIVSPYRPWRTFFILRGASFNVGCAQVCGLALVLWSSPLLSQQQRQQLGRDSITLTLPEARSIAARQNPGLLAASQASAIAAGELRQARAFRFNPDLAVIGRANPELTLTQEVEWAGQRGLRGSAASSDLTRARYEVANAVRTTMADVTIAFYRTLAAQARERVVNQLDSLTERLVQAVRIQLKEGELSVLDANLAEIEAARVRARVMSARRATAQMEIELKRLLRLPQENNVRLIDDSTFPNPTQFDTDSLIGAALRARPDLIAAEAAITAARTRTSLARREAIPNLRAGAVAERDAGAGVLLGISLPFWNRNRGAVAAREAEAVRLRLEEQAIEHRIEAEVRAAVASVRLASAELSLFQQSVLQPARVNAALLEEAYRAGKIPLTTLLLLRNQLLDAEFGYWDAWLARREAQAALEAATGAHTPPIDDTNRAPARNPRDSQ